MSSENPASSLRSRIFLLEDIVTAKKRPSMPLRYRQRNKERIKEEIGTLRLVLVAALGIDATLVGQLFKAFRASEADPAQYATAWGFVAEWFFSFETLIVLAVEIALAATIVLSLRIRSLLRQLEGMT
ncbi:hypothetical protein [uncultured Salinisphaera sp.]|uniref:hypothetical protein n=1 Tax=uncultured Salinisphaera sp. TaxID=359372 RepID=UPI0032B16001